MESESGLGCTRLVMLTRVLDYLDIPISGPVVAIKAFKNGWWMQEFYGRRTINVESSKLIAFNLIQTLNHLGLLRFGSFGVLGFDKFVLRYMEKHER